MNYLPIIKKFYQLGKEIIYILSGEFLFAFLKIIVLYLKNNNKIIRGMFSLFFLKFIQERKIFTIKKINNTEIITIIFCKIFQKSKPNFFKIYRTEIKVTIIFFSKLICSRQKTFQLLGLNGLCILLKKKFYSKLLSNLVHYICFLSIKSFFSNIKSTCVSIIINYISISNDLKFTENLIYQISLSYLSNKKAVFRYNSLNLILKILINLKNFDLHEQLEKILLLTFFHFSFDFDFVCRFFSGLICKFVVSIISKKSQDAIKNKMYILIYCNNKLINIRANIFLDWIYVICNGKKNYCLIKLITFQDYYFFFKKNLIHVTIG
nr:hypothetical protein Cry52Nrm1_p160 [Cryptomonas curvata]